MMIQPSEHSDKRSNEIAKVAISAALQKNRNEEATMLTGLSSSPPTFHNLPLYQR